MTQQEIDALIAEAGKITPEQTAYLERSDAGKEICAVFKPSQMFDVGLKTALGNVRRILER